jgi:hypothetical protein
MPYCLLQASLRDRALALSFKTRLEDSEGLAALRDFSQLIFHIVLSGRERRLERRRNVGRCTVGKVAAAGD